MREIKTINRIDELYHKDVTLFFEYDCDHGKVIDIGENSITILTPAGNSNTYGFGEIKNVEILSKPEEKKNYESNDNMVSHPPHYQSATGLEVIDVIEAFTADLIGIEAADTANVIKYICRWNSKNGLQDLKKAMWYLTHLINHVEKSEKEND